MAKYVISIRSNKTNEVLSQSSPVFYDKKEASQYLGTVRNVNGSEKTIHYTIDEI